MKTRNFVWFAAVILSSVAALSSLPAAGKDDGAQSDTVKAAARQAWTITDLVLEQDLDPPARQQMLLHGLKTLSRLGEGKTPANLAERVSTVTTLEQFTSLLAEVWPNEAVQPDARGIDQREHLLFNGLSAWRTDDEDRGFYLSPQDVKRHEMLAGNRYVGTGIQIRLDDKKKLTQIVVPFPGGPARKAGARPGDLIVEVDGKSMKGLPIRKVVECLQGEEGTKVSMTVRQPGASETRLLPMVRSVIPFSTVHGYRRTGEQSWSFSVDPRSPIGYLSIPDIEATRFLVGRLGGCAIGYLSVDEIKASTLSELRKIEPFVLAEGARAVILDLRFTTGDDLRHAALVADALLDGGIFWRISDRHGRIKKYKADRDCLFRGIPTVVLVGEYTGSLAAMVAAALQDHGPAITVGEMPKAELVVTSRVPLPEERGVVQVRTGRVERSGRADFSERQQLAAATYRLWPDHVVDIERKDMAAVMEWRQQQQSPEPKAGAKPPADPQLNKAISLLRETLAKHDKEDKE